MSRSKRVIDALPRATFLKNVFRDDPFFFALALTVVLFPAHHLIVPLIGVALFGISHGSRDHRLLLQTSLFGFAVSYIFRAAIFLGLWWLSPETALLIFLVLSAEHFGACQFARELRSSVSGLWAKISAFAWGAFASIGSPLFHWNEALPILRSILRSPSALSFVPTSLPLSIGIGMAVLALLSAATFDRYELNTKGDFRSAFWRTGLLVVSFAALPLLAGFLLFFAFWHSIDSIRHQKMPDQLSWRNYYLQALALTAASWLSLAGLFFWLGMNWGVFFVALGAVTLPHSFVMRKFYDSQKKGLNN